MKKPEIENLNALVRGVALNKYQRADAITEFFRIKAYIQELEELPIPAVEVRSDPLFCQSSHEWKSLDDLPEDYQRVAANNCWLKFDDGSECRYNDDWNFAQVTHYSHT